MASLIPCTPKQFSGLMLVYEEGRAKAEARSFPTDPNKVICDESEVPYPAKSVEAIAFMLGFVNWTLGRFAGRHFDRPPITDPSRN